KKGASPQQLEQADSDIAAIQTWLQQLPAVRLERRFVRLMATYWLAQIAYERGGYADAADYFRYLRDTEAPALLKAIEALPDKATTDLERNSRQMAEHVIKPMLSILTPGANYNLARALEAEGRYAEAIDAYGADTSADQRPGSLYRARRLEQELAEKAKATEAKK